MKPKFKKIRQVVINEFDVTFEFEGKQKKRHIEIVDNKLKTIHGIASHDEWQYLKQIVEEYFY